MTEPQSPLNPRDFVELLDELIKKRTMHPYNPMDAFNRPQEIEILKRQLTDYLLDIDKRPGVYVKGENEA